MFDSLKAFLVSFVSFRLALGCYVLYKIGDSIFDTCNTDLVKYYLLASKDDKDRRWQNGYWVEIAGICVDVIKLTIYIIAWCMVKDVATTNIRISLKEMLMKEEQENMV